MTPHYTDHSVTLYHCDCLDVLRDLPDQSVDAVVTDPPYNLSFMGKAWDAHANARAFQDWCEEWAAECLRVLKPGGHMLAFGGTRTFHRLACAVEDAGFEIRDSIAWLYGSGFPKSLDVSKAIDKAAGATREVVGQKVRPYTAPREGMLTRKGRAETGYRPDGAPSVMERADERGYAISDVTAPATDAARHWQGWGTALKPAFEPVVVARKPLVGTVAANVLEYGTGALNVDGCRIGTNGGGNACPGGDLCACVTSGISYSPTKHPVRREGEFGRWPANVIVDESQAAALDQMSGDRPVSGAARKGETVAHGSASVGDVGFGIGQQIGGTLHNDSGGASRFMYTAKADAGERVFYYRLTCDCETIKPCPDTSQLLDTDACESPDDTSWNTSTSGSRPTVDPSHQDTTSTTATATNSTTTSATSSSSPSSSTNGSTPAVSSATANGGNPAPSATSLNGSASTTGISAPKGGPSTADAAPAISRGLSATSVCGRCGAPAKRESHSTVKPLSLMRWLVRLVTPPGGTVLEPFAGSGTTVEACILEGLHCIAIEREADYLPLIVQRVNRQRDPIAYTAAAGEDLGLFGFEELA